MQKLKPKISVLFGLSVLTVTAVVGFHILQPAPAEAAFPTAALLDNFNRADTTSIGGQTSSSGNIWGNSKIESLAPTDVGISSNRADINGSGDNAYLNTQFGPDSEVYVDVPVLPEDGNYAAIYARLQTPGDGLFDTYALIYIHSTSGNATWSLRRYNDSAPTVLSNISAASIAAGDSLGLEVTGTGSSVTVTAYKKTSGIWSTVGSANDSNASRITSAGYLGFEIGLGGPIPTRIDNFSGGTLVTNQTPVAPSTSSPASGATGISITPQFQMRSTDVDNDYLRYKIEVCADSSCSTIVRTIDQTASQTGWSGQDQQTGSAYTGNSLITSSTMATYTYQAPALSNSTQYWWRSYSIDPGGTNTFSSPSAVLSFTTAAGVTSSPAPPAPPPSTPPKNSGLPSNK
jgi:hypothetical protein